MKEQIKGKNILILGLARSGQAAIKLLLKAGASRVIGNDQKSLDQLTDEMNDLCRDSRVTLVGGGHPEHLVDEVSLVIKSPGIKPDLPLLHRALARGIPVYSEIELAYWFSSAEIVGITGTNGKTTTTSLVGEIFQGECPQVFVAGNIGYPLCEAVDAARSGDLIVAELSSFQLENIETFRTPIAAVLNISSDHLDYHGTMPQYIQAKSRLLANQQETDMAVLNYDDENVRDLQDQVQGRLHYFSRKYLLEAGVCLQKGRIVIRENGNEEFICHTADLLIPGLHNLENALAAVAVTRSRGVRREKIASALKSFRGVPHRLEFVSEINGVRFVNDSKGTNEEATLTALKALQGSKILIAGGMDKGSSFHHLAAALLSEKVSWLILLGETAPLLQKRALAAGFSRVVLVSDLPDAVAQAYLHAAAGDTVLLSPACASWDMFSSYEERGDVFKFEVGKLKEGLSHGKSPRRG